jgi:hypothetical protein
MLTRLHTLELRRYLLLIPGITLAVMMTGCGSTDFTSVSIEYPVHSTGRTERHAMTSELIVADKRLDKSVDRLVKTPLVGAACGDSLNANREITCGGKFCPKPCSAGGDREVNDTPVSSARTGLVTSSFIPFWP